MLSPNLRHSLTPLVFAVAVVGLHLAIVSFGKAYWLTQLTMALYYSIVVLGLTLVTGFAGQVSLGHAAFFAIGGYSAAILTTHNFAAFQGAKWAAFLSRAGILASGADLYGSATLTFCPWAAFVVALAASAGLAAFIGFPALRLRGYYLAMATLGFGIIVYKVLLGSPVAGAADGITNVPEWPLIGRLAVSGSSALRVQNYYIACGVVLVAMVLLGNLVRSRIGRALLAIHDREIAANAMGINTPRYKLQAFIMSAVLAAAAGVFFTHYTGGIGPSEAGPLKSVRYLALVATGGMTSLWGVLVISTAINYCSLRGWFGTYDNAVFGALLVAVISLAPDGPLEPVGRWIRRLAQVWR